MANVQLDYSDIEDIFKEKLKIDNIVKKVKTIFLNDRYLGRIDYKPYFQRNYVWDDEKASYFIESIILGTEIPPLVLFEGKQKIEVIDGRQRFETITRFLKDKLILKENGLHSLKKIAGKKYSQLSPEIQEVFEETRIRIIQFSVVDEPKLEEEKEDKIKKEIFRRYNSGITPLQKYDIERAAYISDELSVCFNKALFEDEMLYDFLSKTILPSSKRKQNKRDKVNVLVALSRNLIALPYIPIASYARATSKVEIIGKAYRNITDNSDLQERSAIVRDFKEKVFLIKKLYNKINDEKLANNNLFFETVFWALSVSKLEKSIINEEKINEIDKCLKNASAIDEIWIGLNYDTKSIYSVYEKTGSHYYSAINGRYKFISNVFSKVMGTDFNKYLRGNNQLDNQEEICEVNYYKLNKPLPETLTIEDILSEMKRNRFLIRPEYQRSEVKDLAKASYLMESILLGVSIPPIFVYKRKDKVKEVVDGQQRLLTIIGFLGKTYLNENGTFSNSSKDKFKLSRLRILTDLNGKNIDKVGEVFESKVLDFPIDVIEIDEELNPEFSQIDLFLRLNSKPYPIKENTFEMWNAYIAKEVTLEVKKIANQYEGLVYRKKDNRMKLEELIITLAYLEYKVCFENARVTNVLNFYIRNGRLCARIKNKDNVTKLLSDISNGDVKPFIDCLKKITLFSEKMKQLLDDESSFKQLVHHSRKGSSYKTDQNFYFLWLMLHDVSFQDIENDTQKYFEQLTQYFTIIQNIPNGFLWESFIEQFM